MDDTETSAELTPRVIDSLYVEAMVLADEARAYFDSAGRDERLGLDPVLRIGFACESLKVTTRLMQVVAWLMTRRAVAAGDLPATAAHSAERRLGDAPESDEALLPRLPAAAADLVRASRDLYDRVRRIDEGAAPEPQSSPARSLLNRLQRSL
ncbi:MAG: regulator of CtrA degradation [Sphingomonadales bacterium]|jgi:regulator of CtrA degradation|nr:regulator of CtrA degradation [Sphingomonadales bacterium]